MRQQWRPWTALWLVTLVGLTACTYDAAIRQLSPAEQSEFYLYHHRLTGSQERTYLAKASAAERTAYLRAIGLPQRFEALDPLDQQAVRSWLAPSRDERGSPPVCVGGAVLYGRRCEAFRPLALSRIVARAGSIWQSEAVWK